MSHDTVTASASGCLNVSPQAHISILYLQNSTDSLNRHNTITSQHRVLKQLFAHRNRSVALTHSTTHLPSPIDHKQTTIYSPYSPLPPGAPTARAREFYVAPSHPLSLSSLLTTPATSTTPAKLTPRTTLRKIQTTIQSPSRKCARIQCSLGTRRSTRISSVYFHAWAGAPAPRCHKVADPRHYASVRIGA